MFGYFLIGGLVLMVFVVTTWRIVEHRRKLFRKSLSCDEGEFLVRGKKEKFTIKKDGRFEFSVVDGQIVSVTDKQASVQPVRYGRIENGEIR